MVSLTGKYALRILGYLAERTGQWVRGEEVARETGIPANYLGKILNQLRKAGYVVSQKGWGGGFMLDDAFASKPIAGVLELFEGRRSNDECVFELRSCNPDNPCPLHGHWQRIRKEYERMLSTVTVADLRGEAAR
jgi:Rrf2 family protein